MLRRKLVDGVTTNQLLVTLLTISLSINK